MRLREIRVQLGDIPWSPAWHGGGSRPPERERSRSAGEASNVTLPEGCRAGGVGQRVSTHNCATRDARPKAFAKPIPTSPWIVRDGSHGGNREKTHCRVDAERSLHKDESPQPPEMVATGPDSSALENRASFRS